MKRLYKYIIVAVSLLAIVSCSGSKNVAYIKYAGEIDLSGYMQTTPLYDAQILPKDLLTITVVATDPRL